MEHISPASGSMLWPLAIFVIAYALIISERINRSVIALLGGGAMILAGLIDQTEAIRGIDFNTLGLLTGMMIIVAITQKSGIFQYAAIVSAKRVKADPWGLLIMFSIVTAGFSALLDNVTAVMLITAVALVITDALEITPYPYLYSIIFSSNIGGMATLIGDPPNIMIGSAAHLSFNAFLIHMAPIAALVAVASIVPVYLIWGRKLKTTAEARRQVMEFNERDAIKDVRLLRQSLLVIAAVLLGFVFGHPIGIEPSAIAMTGAGVLLLLQGWGQPNSKQNDDAHHAYSQVEWVTIFFFVGLFIMVAAVEKSGALQLLSQFIVTATAGNYQYTVYTVLWSSALFSAVFDNIPFVATMIPVIKSMASQFGDAQLQTLWWSLAMGACLGGNGSLIGASANLVVAGFAERAGYSIRFVPFLLFAFPIMLMGIGICHIYIYLRYF